MAHKPTIPPLSKMPLCDPKTGIATPAFFQFLQQLWTAVTGEGQIGDGAIAANKPVPMPQGYVEALILESGVRVLVGTGSPIGAVWGNVGDIYINIAGGSATTLYVKESGAATQSGWVGK